MKNKWANFSIFWSTFWRLFPPLSSFRSLFWKSEEKTVKQRLRSSEHLRFLNTTSLSTNVSQRLLSAWHVEIVLFKSILKATEWLFWGSFRNSSRFWPTFSTKAEFLISTYRGNDATTFTSFSTTHTHPCSSFSESSEPHCSSFLKLSAVFFICGFGCFFLLFCGPGTRFSTWGTHCHTLFLLQPIIPSSAFLVSNFGSAKPRRFGFATNSKFSITDIWSSLQTLSLFQKRIYNH